MAGSTAGGLKAAKTNREKFGADFYARIGATGGSTPTKKKKGFAANPELARRAGIIGGKYSPKKARNDGNNSTK